MYENTTELTHYGVKGMRWGHRKASYYDQRVAANRNRASKAITARGKARALNRAEINKYYADRARRISKSKNLKDRIIADYGFEDASKAMTAWSNMERNNAKASRTKLGRQMHKVAAENNDAYANIYKNISNVQGVKNKVKVAVKGIASKKTTHLSGRKVGLGEGLVESLIPGMGLMRDWEYYRDHKKQFGKV